MIFADYYFLYALVLIALLYPLMRESRKLKASVKFSSRALPRKTSGTKIASEVFFWGRILAAILIILALARPREITRSEIPPAYGVDIILCLDTSYSMAAMDFEPNRLEVAKKAAVEFVRSRKQDRIGLVAFGGSAILTCPLTNDHETLSDFIESTRINMIDAKGTAVGDAIMTAINHVKNGKAKSKVIILLTDGRSNTGVIKDPSYAAKIAETFGIKIYTVGTAKKGRALIPTNDPFNPYTRIDDDLDEATLMEVAALTGGKFYRAENPEQLERIYSQIDSLEKTEFKMDFYVSRRDLYHRFLWPALALAALIFLFENTLMLRLP